MSVLASGRARASAHPNIALIKYWGKASDSELNEPAVSSLSLTLDELRSETCVAFDESLKSDELWLNGKRDEQKLARISANLDKLRRIAGIDTRCRVETSNNFPTAAGLASSASGFAALVAAGNAALGLGLDLKQQSMLARAMSGSAARSLYGGFAKIYLPDAEPAQTHFGSAYAEQVAEAEHWPLEVCVAIVSEDEKKIGSTEGMERSRLSSPYYQAWLSGNDVDVVQAEKLVLARDFEQLAELSEFSCLKMHAMAMASRPGLLYWSGATVDAMHCVRELRAGGVPVFFTNDAGPQLKAICAPGYGAKVADALAELHGVKRVLRCALGPGARVEALD
ncbi:diphosphomevalonate decarboxylase [Agaribacterium haliotis]|uniref:diphosphomevalonate decarboxylase n=1 Tax=Agaribacterium haliotis TaxID=2013869 RepID=UPI001EFEBB27|nr:diphosphomevalonate decarboxylase [Agaribacterium haliotis]